METSLLLQGLLWGGLLLGLISELLRPRIQGDASLKILAFDFAELKRSFAKAALPALVPVVFGIVLQYYGGFSNAAFLLAGFLLPWLLSCFISLPAANGLLLLGLAWLLPTAASAQPENLPGVNVAVVGGMLLFQLLQSLTLQANDQKTVDARVVLPAAIWLVGVSWIQTAIPDDANMKVLQATTALFLVGGAVFRLLPMSRNAVLERFGKPLALAAAAAGGMCVLADVAFHQSALTRWAMVILGGVLAGGYFASRSEEPDNGALLPNLLNLAVLGIVMLAASRLFGTLGWIVAAAGIALTHIDRLKTPNSVWQAAALFLLGRGLLQVFIYDANPNVTGINITHPYAGAALFAGVALILRARDIHRSLSVAAGVTLWAVVGLGACYYLHAEATGSLLVSCLFAAGAVTFVPSSLFGQVGFQGGVIIQQSKTTLVLLACWLAAYCALAAPSIALGNEATKITKLLVLLIPFALGLFILKPLSGPVKTVS